MPRPNRIHSYTNVYHIIMRGNNKQNIFMENKDFQRFLLILKKYKIKYEYDLYCYILMTNHIHMIINSNKTDISRIMHSIAQEYSIYFNNKYDRCGHVFQDRFKSKCVESKQYLLNLQRYIHLNCVKAGIGKIDSYKWSSYNEFVKREKLCKTNLILKLFGNDRKSSIKNFIIFNQKTELSPEEQNISEFEIKKLLSDEEAKEMIQIVIKNRNFKELKDCNEDDKDKLIKECIKISGISKRQLARIFQYDKRRIDRILK